MKALTIWQPWASLIIVGAKPFEFRGHRAPHFAVGRRLVIHAGSRSIVREEVEDLLERLADPETAWTTGLLKDKATPVLELALSDASRPKVRKGRALPLFGEGPPVLDADLNLPLGAGLGTAYLGEPLDGLAAAERLGATLEHGRAVNDSDRDEKANWAWPMRDVEAWREPVPCKGAQGLWDWPEGGEAGRFAGTV